MQTLLILRPPRRNYLVSQTVFVLIIIAMTSFVSIFVFRDVLRGFSGTIGSSIGLVVGGLLVWAYDEIKKFERWSIILTENAIIMAGGGYKKRVYLVTGLDKQRTIAYNSENNLRNQFFYTFWFVTGEKTMIGKSFYGTAQIKALLEKIGFSTC